MFWTIPLTSAEHSEMLHVSFLRTNHRHLVGLRSGTFSAHRSKILFCLYFDFFENPAAPSWFTGISTNHHQTTLAEVFPGDVLIPLYLFVAGRIVRKLTPLHERRPLVNCIRMRHRWSNARLVISLSPLLKMEEIFSRENNVSPVCLLSFCRNSVCPWGFSPDGPASLFPSLS